MKLVDNIDVVVVMRLISEDADRRALAAGMGGRNDDGGASTLRTQLHFFNLGLQQSFPPEWKKYAEEYKKVTDLEYAEYARLCKKFENK